MRSRLEDLISTGERQFGSKSYDAAIDTFRTALGEPGAKEAGVEERLDGAVRARDAARGMGQRAVETAAVPEAKVEAEAAAVPEAKAEAEAAGAAERAVEEPAPWRFRTVEPPAFHLMEDDPSMLERPGRERREGLERPEVEPLGILDPTPPPRDDGVGIQRLAILAFVAIVLMGVIAIFLTAPR